MLRNILEAKTQTQTIESLTKEIFSFWFKHNMDWELYLENTYDDKFIEQYGIEHALDPNKKKDLIKIRKMILKDVNNIIKEIINSM